MVKNLMKAILMMVMMMMFFKTAWCPRPGDAGNQNTRSYFGIQCAMGSSGHPCLNEDAARGQISVESRLAVAKHILLQHPNLNKLALPGLLSRILDL